MALMLHFILIHVLINVKQYVIHVKVVVGEEKKNKVDFHYNLVNNLIFK
jgi:hypothetical protein